MANHRIQSADYTDHSAEGCCCAVIEALACAVSAIRDQHCCCKESGDTAGCACCTESLGHVLDAIALHVKCLRGACSLV